MNELEGITVELFFSLVPLSLPLRFLLPQFAQPLISLLNSASLSLSAWVLHLCAVIWKVPPCSKLGNHRASLICFLFLLAFSPSVQCLKTSISDLTLSSFIVVYDGRTGLTPFAYSWHMRVY